MSTTAKKDTATPVEVTEKKVTIRLPVTRDQNDDLFVAINGRTWLIKRGVEVEVPDFVAAAINRHEEALMEAYRKQAELESK